MEDGHGKFPNSSTPKKYRESVLQTKRPLAQIHDLKTTGREVTRSRCSIASASRSQRHPLTHCPKDLLADTSTYRPKTHRA